MRLVGGGQSFMCAQLALFHGDQGRFRKLRAGPSFAPNFAGLRAAFAESNAGAPPGIENPLRQASRVPCRKRAIWNTGVRSRTLFA
jgi:hypothetical protein